MKEKIITIAVCLLVIISQNSCGKEKSVSDNGFYLDTTCTITLYNIEKEKGEKLIAKGFDICKKYEKMLSKTVAESDVYRINEAKGEAVQVSDDTIKVIATGIRLGEVSGGKFDITIGRLTDLWDFKRDHPSVPSEEAIQEAVQTVDYRMVYISGNSVTLSNGDAKLDLGGLAKGYIADQVAQMLVDAGVTQGIVNLGGNVVTIGEKEDGIPWKVGIQRPYSDQSKVIGTVPAKDKTVVTSGIYERYFTVDGTQYHHIIDPSTGYPVKNDLESVTIVGKRGTSMECDAYSTICLLVGREKALALLEKHPEMEALFLDKDDYVTMTKGMDFQQ